MVAKLDYGTLREVITRVERAESGDSFSHTIFSMRETESPGRAHLRITCGFEVEFISHPIKSKVLRQLEVLHHLNTTVMIEIKRLQPSSSYAGFLYEAFAARELASRKSFPGLVSMRAEIGKTTVPIQPT